ncbi:MAG TPA: sigma-70 family RNA polymerase sigma factor [Allosphingosinicella sp.]
MTGVAPTFEEIVSEYGALISRIAMSYESDITQREDLVQQIFLAIWQALPTFRGDSSVKTFVGKIAQNRSISHVAKRVREPRIAELPEELATETPSPEDSANDASERRLLLAKTRLLPLPQRQVIILVLEGFSYGEIADMLEIAPNALWVRMTRAKAALKRLLEQDR